MADLCFARVDERAYRVLRSWFRDPELQRRYCRPTRQWLRYVQLQPQVGAWMVYEDGAPVGHLQLDVDDAGTGHLGFLVNPDLRGRGYGRRLLQAFLALPEAQRLRRVVAHVEPDNLASIRCLQAARFEQVGSSLDEEGLLTFAAGIVDLTVCTGAGQFGRAYEFMLEHDAHARGSVDCELACAMVRLCPETVDHLYSSFTPLDILYKQGSRAHIERILTQVVPADAGPEVALSHIVEYTQGLGELAEQDLHRMRVGGTEEQIVERGSGWCTDVARVACVLCQVAGLPCRIAYLFNLDQAYSGHVIVEAHRARTWGAADPSTGVVYRQPRGEPATVWDLMRSPKLVEAHQGPGAFYTTPGQFRAAGIANYFCWQPEAYDYTITGLNAYYISILEMSRQGWPGGLRWLHGEDAAAATPCAPADADGPRG